MGTIASSYPSLQPAAPSPRASLPGLGKWNGRCLHVSLWLPPSLCAMGEGGTRGGGEGNLYLLSTQFWTLCLML